MKLRYTQIVALLLVLVIGIGVASAQSICRAPGAQDFQALNTNCQSVGMNTTCIGQGEVVVTTADGEQTLRAGDRIANDEIISIDTTGSSQLPIIYSRMLANLPATYANEAVVSIITGPAVIRNFDDNLLTDELVVVEATVSTATDLLSFPPDFGDRESTVLGTLAAGATVSMDVRTADGAYVRIDRPYDFASEFGMTGQRASVWIASEALEDADAVAALPVLNADQFTPLQNLDVQPADGCGNVRVMSQSQACVQAEMGFNGLGKALGATVTMRLALNASGDYELVIAPLMGAVMLPNPDFPDNARESIVIRPATALRIPTTTETLDDGSTRVLVDFTTENFDEIKEAYLAALEDGSAFVDRATIDEQADFRVIAPGLLSYDIIPPVILVPSGVGNPTPIYEVGELPVCN